MDFKSAEGNNKHTAKTKVEIDVEKHLLETTIKLSDGSDGKIFSRAPRNESDVFIYNCHLCGVPNLPGERCLQTHIAGRKHQTKLSLPVDAELFRIRLSQKPSRIQMNIAPGEPVPPGFENEIKPVADIQKKIDKHKNEPLVALEYLMELAMGSGKEPLYHCVLCDKRGDPRSIFLHLESNNHRIKFLDKHYPTVMRELRPYQNTSHSQHHIFGRAVRKVCEAIEDHYGRLTPTVHDIDEYNKNRTRFLQEVIFEKHFDEKTGPKFLEIVDKRYLDEIARRKKKTSEGRDITGPKRNNLERKSLVSISSSSLSRSRSRSRSPIKRFKFDSKNFYRPTFTTSISRSRSRSPQRSRGNSPSEHSKFDRFKKSPSPRYSKKESDFDFRKKSPSRNMGRKYDKKSYDVVDRERRKYSKERSSLDKKDIHPRKIPTPKELSAQASEIGQERYKWEKYRCTLEIAMDDMEKKFKEHEKNPEQHPDYPEEWKNFWNRRYKELLSDKKDPAKHDFKPEWIEFWTCRMKELHDDEKAKKVKEIRKKMNLGDEAEEKTDELKKQYTIKTQPKKKSPIEPIAISDDSDENNSKFSVSSKKRYEESKRSRSPWSVERDRDKERYRDRSPSRHSFSQDISRDKYKERDEYLRKMEYGQTYDDWAKSYYGPNRPVFIRNVPDKYGYDGGEDDGTITLVSVCRLLTALEDNLGSLGPKVLDLLSKALALEKVKANSSEETLLNDDNCVFFETVKEKLKGQLIAGMIHSSKINPIKRAIKNIATLIHQVSQKNNTEKDKLEVQSIVPETFPKSSIDTSKSTVTGIDKIALAQQIAGALIAQGKTDVTQDQLEQLVNVYVSMAEASKTNEKPISTRDYLNDLEKNKNTSSTSSSGIAQVKTNDKKHNPENLIKEKDGDVSEQPNPLESLTDSDLQTLLQNFKDLSPDEQHNLIAHLKQLEITDPTRVENLKKFVNLTGSSFDNSQENSKNSSEAVKNNTSDSFGLNRTKKDSYRNMSPEPSTSKTPISRIIDSDDDDDDYSFDDVVRAASKNIDVKKDGIGSSNYRADEDNSNTSKSSSRIDTSLTDTKNIIANLMGSLQKSVSRANTMNIDSQSTQGTANVNNSNNSLYSSQMEENYNQHSTYPIQQQDPYHNYSENGSNNMPYYYHQQQQQQQQPNLHNDMSTNNMYPGSDMMMQQQQPPHPHHPNFNNYGNGYCQPDNMPQMQNNYYQNYNHPNNQQYQQNLIEYPNMRQGQQEQPQQGNNIQVPYNNYY